MPKLCCTPLSCCGSAAGSTAYPVCRGLPQPGAAFPRSICGLVHSAAAGILTAASQVTRKGQHRHLRRRGGRPTAVQVLPPLATEPLDSPFPLERFEDNGIPSAARFLWWERTRSQGRRCPGTLRSGLHVLDLDVGWLELDAPPAYAEAMAVRRAVLAEEGGQSSLVLVDDGESQGAQAELLDLVAEYLARRHPARFALQGEGHARQLASLAEGLSWRFRDYEARPLALLGQLLQEDLCLMREDGRSGGAAAGEHGGHGAGRHLFVAGCVMDSFDPVEKHMLPMLELHGPVPRYATDLHESMGQVFKALRKPFWRANFGLMEWREEGEGEELALSDEERLDRMYLKVEYETLRRLPLHAEYLVFTIRRHLSPLPSLAKTPFACAALATELRNLPPELLAYKGFASPETCGLVLRFLDHICAVHGLTCEQLTAGV